MLAARRLALAVAAALGCNPIPAPTDTDGDASTAAATTGDDPGDSTTTGPTTTADDSSSTADATTTSTTTTDSTGVPVDPGCGDGVPAPGELCFVSMELDFLDFAEEATLADLDGDGHLDIVGVAALPCPLVLAPSQSLQARPTPTREGGFLITFSAFLGDGAGGFMPGPVLDGAQHVPRGMRAGEFTGDDLHDIVGVSETGGVALFTATGGGALDPGVEFALPFFAASLERGDLDGDGDLDIVAAGAEGIAVLRNDGPGNFTISTFGDDGGVRNALAPFDLDADGDLDLVVARWGDDAGTVETHFNAGDGTFTLGQSLALAGSVSSFAGVDPAMNGGPAVLAIVWQGGGENVLVAFPTDDGGALGEPEPITSPPRELLATGRFDGDARDDLLLAGVAGIDTILGRDPWPPAPASIAPGPLDGLAHVVVGDIDEDGIDDLLLGPFPDRLLLSNP